MRILWIVNTIFPYPAKMLEKSESVFGGWMIGLQKSLIKNNEVTLAIASVYDGKELKKYSDDNVIYYLLPTKNKTKYDNGLSKYWQIVYNDYKPDLVHLHGTEYIHGLSFLRTIRNVKTVVSIQGSVGVCGELYLYGISFLDIIKNITLRDIIKNDSMFMAKKKLLRRGKYEKEILARVDGIVGRTTWDYALVQELSDANKYYFCNEILRDKYYQNIWDYKKIEKETIFISQGSYSIKGLHEIIKALPIIKKYYPKVVVYVAGSDMLNSKSLRDKLRLTGYVKYIRKLIEKYHVYENIKFTGVLNEQEMIDKMQKCNVFLQTSIIENSSNSLGEAMILGMPIVASNVGGTSDMLKDKEEGFLYPYGERNLLSKYIMDVFENPTMAIQMGIKAREHAQITHSKEKNSQRMIEIYQKILNKMEDK